ncbi:MAG TPA: PilZ domain-containing protein [Vicinamibacterales bacterium]|jgi:hypothetical protein|nr:PilZ domain-containing protein [Vicinamibacterales bacterium]
MSPSTDLNTLAKKGTDALVASLDKERAAIEALAKDLCAAADAALAKERERGAAELLAAEAAQRATTEQLEEARRRIDDTKGQLDAARRQADSVRGELDEARRQLDEAHTQFSAAEAQAAERSRHAEEAATRAQAEIEAAREAHTTLLAQLEDARDALAASDRVAHERAAVLERVTSALRAIRSAASSKDIFDVLLDALNAHFERVAILIAGAGGLKCWLHRGFESDSGVDNLILGFDARSPAMLALQTREVIEIERSDATPITGLCGNPISKALAIPMVAAERTIAVAYTESRTLPLPEDFEIGRRLGEILVEFASRRVNTKRPQIDTAQPLPTDGEYSVQRRARRLRMRDAVNIMLDGSASFLIDLSTRGAQVLSPAGLRPKQDVRIMLVVGDRTIECAGRVVWALFEQARGASGALYRAGVEFVDVDTPSVEAFLAGMGMARRELVAR